METRRGRVPRTSASIAVALLSLVGLLTASAARAQVSGVAAPLANVGTGGTDTKPESKCFYAQGAWWCALLDGTKTYLWKYDGTYTWTKQPIPGGFDSSKSGRADCLSVGNTLYVSIVAGGKVSLYKFGYNGANYVRDPDPAWPVLLSIGAGSAVITQDSTGRLWLAADVASSTRIEVYYTAAGDDRAWDPVNQHFTLDGNVLADISSVVAIGGNAVGVFWSNHVADSFNFRVHFDADPPTTWQAQEIVEQGPIAGLPLADNHVHLAVAADGRVYAAVKTSFDTPGLDNLALYRRDAAGVWSPRVPVVVWPAAPKTPATRPVVELYPATNTVYVFYTNLTNGSTGGIIEYRTSDMNTLSFGAPHTFIAYWGSRFNDVSSTKDGFSPASNVVAVSKDQITSVAYFDTLFDRDGDGWSVPGDCNDNNPLVNPGAVEIPYNGIDDDCNPATPDDDLDGDGYRVVPLNPGDPVDCNDNDPNVNPGHPEVPYNGKDDDCNPATPDDDLDGDGYRVVPLHPGDPVDCNDNDPTVHPGAVEIPYNGKDDDCNPATKDDDLDGDGYRVNPLHPGDPIDCNDNDPNINPGHPEVPYNGKDDDCNPATPDDDLDGDGYRVVPLHPGDPVDCNDLDPTVHPGAKEIPYNGKDDDCNPATPDDDLDGDGYRVNPLHPGDPVDCNDNDPTVNPGMKEIPYNGKDDDCNPATPDDDLDGDGYRVVPLHPGDPVDCNDSDPNVNPGHPEIPYNGKDDDCNPATPDDDLDGDGYRVVPLHPGDPVDCNDNDPNVNPGHPEIPYNGKDDDCNPATPDDDLDGDGYRVVPLHPGDPVDCNDLDPNVNPGHPEVPYNGKDDDCNPATPDDDLDGDGFRVVPLNPGDPVDCNDNDPAVHPGAIEVPYNGKDDDCDPATPDDDLDGDGYRVHPLNPNDPADCDDTNPNVNPGMTEIPFNGIDDDCNPATKDDPVPPAAPQGLQQAAAVALLLHVDEGKGGVTISAEDLKLKGTFGAVPGPDAKDPLWQAGRFGKALLFDGVNDFVRFPATTAVDMTGSFTVEAWIARRLPTTGEDTVLVKGVPGRRNYRLFLTAGGKVGFLWDNGSKTHPNAPTLGTIPIADTAWHHVACVFDAVLGENRIYVDGRLDSTAATTGLPLVNKGPLFLGAAALTGSDAFSGLVDEVRVSSIVRYRGNVFTPPAAPFSWPNAVHLRWSANQEPDLAGYNVYRGDKSGGPYTKLNGGLLTEPTYDDTTTNPLLPRLFYVVTAVDTSENESAFSPEIRAKAPPSPP